MMKENDTTANIWPRLGPPMLIDTYVRTRSILAELVVSYTTVQAGMPEMLFEFVCFCDCRLLSDVGTVYPDIPGLIPKDNHGYVHCPSFQVEAEGVEPSCLMRLSFHSSSLSRLRFWLPRGV